MKGDTEHHRSRATKAASLAGDGLAWALLILAAWLAWRGRGEGVQAWNRALLLVWWSLAALLAGRLGRERVGGWPLLLALLAGAGAHFLLWKGLALRGVVDADAHGLLRLGWPLAGAAVLAAAAWLVMGLLGLPRDGVLLVGAVGLFCLGLAILGRIGAEYTGSGRREVLAFLAQRHLAWFGLGLAAMIGAVALATPRRLARLGRKKYLLALTAAGLLLLTWLAGPEINQRRLWLTLGPVTLQTVELAKLLLVLFAAGYFADEYPFLLERRRPVKAIRLVGAAGPFAVMLGLPLLALFIQRDLGPAVLLGLFFLAMVYLGTGAWWLSLSGLGLAALAGGLGWRLGMPAMLCARVEAWLDPFHTSEQLSRGLWSIAAGGLWGSGWGLGRPHTVPLSYSDFVFAALAEETGLMGAAALLALAGVLVARLFVSAGRSSQAQARLAAAGVGILLGLQTFLVTAGVCGLIPLAGLTLPLVSHGGSSLVVNLALLGLAMGATGRAG